MFLATLAFAASMLQVPTGEPAPLPNGATGLGAGSSRLDDNPNTAERTPNPDATGGATVRCHYMHWTLYIKPSGVTNIQAFQTCMHECKGSNEHDHGADCKIGGCSNDCPYANHNVELETKVESTSREFQKETYDRARKTFLSATNTLKMDAKVLGVKVNDTLVTKGEQTDTESISLVNSISKALTIGHVSKLPIALGHFNDAPCQNVRWAFGSVEYELHLVVQIYTVEYEATGGFVIGAGTSGTQPRGKLKKFSGPDYQPPTDDVIAKFDLISNEPLDRRTTPNCKCRARTATGVGGGEHSMAVPPSGGHTVSLDPKPGDEVVIRNPLKDAIFVSSESLNVRVDPGQETAVKPSDTNGYATLKDITGVAIMTVGLMDVSRHERREQPAMHGVDLALGGKEGKMGKLSIDLPQIPAPRVEERPANPLEVVAGDIPNAKICTIGPSRTQTLMLNGRFEKGSQFVLEGRNGERSMGNVFAELRRNGEIVQTALNFNDVPEGSCRLVAVSPEGKEEASRNVTVVKPNFSTSLSPKDGKPGQSATLTIDCRDLIAVVQEEGLGMPSQFSIAIDYSQSGGAQGPTSIDIPASGVAKVRVVRGSIPGEFRVLLGLVPKGTPPTLAKMLGAG